MSIVSKNIDKAVELLSNGDLVAIPTETVYGLAGNIYSDPAIKSIFSTKKRPLSNPLIVHLHSIEQLNKLTNHLPKTAKTLAEQFWPGPLTLVLPKSDTVPDIITAGKDTVAIRIPNHPVTLELLKKLDFPIAAPSANPFNRISPTSAHHVESYFKDDIKMILDGGNCSAGIESTIIGFEGETPVLFRLGSISLEDIESVVGKVKIKNQSDQKPDAPGMLKKHYSPLKKTYLVQDINQTSVDFNMSKIAVLTFKPCKLNIQHKRHLSSTGDINEAASNLYEMLHQLDQTEVDAIVIERLPDEGLGKAINDRLERASS